MTVIELNRKRNVLRIGKNREDVEEYIDVTMIYDVTHVTPSDDGPGWYDIYRGKTILGFITDVESVQEKW